MNLTDEEREIFRSLRNQAAEYGIKLSEYFEAMVDAVGKGFEEHPNDRQKAYKHTTAILDEKYPKVKEGGEA